MTSSSAAENGAAKGRRLQASGIGIRDSGLKQQTNVYFVDFVDFVCFVGEE